MIRLSDGVRLVELERGGVVESVHTGHLVVLDADGTTRFQLGDPAQPMFARSSLKPLQAIGILRAGAVLEPDELALATASHSGSPQHLAMISAMLTGAGLTEDDLDCPPDLPAGVAEQRRYLAAGLSESRLAMNCSGKHAAMLLACLANSANGWSIADYLAPSHPLQQLLAATVTEIAGEPIASTAVDGCGAPLFAISLRGLARSFSRIATGDGQLRQVAEAMRGYPELVGGEQRAATTLMRRVPGLIAKDGAEGVFAAALPDGGAIALKIDDGAMRAANCAAAWSLHHLGVDVGPLEELFRQPVLGGGEPVGVIGPAPNW